MVEKVYIVHQSPSSSITAKLSPADPEIISIRQGVDLIHIRKSQVEDLIEALKGVK